ncbi:MAG: hypothetical protein H7196_03985 [candidate division SR1 bacterium]|nr:hypothetical protein [candidate division SR1 bacterium]
MPIKKSIIFELNNNLRVYAIADSVNSWTHSLELIRELNRQEKGLELANKFEFLWEDLDTSGEFEGINEAYFLIGSYAGFTDTRMIFMWLKSWTMFDPTCIFYIKRIVFDVPIDFVDPKLLKNLLLEAKTENNNSEISYSKEPNITRKLY